MATNVVEKAAEETKAAGYQEELVVKAQEMQVPAAILEKARYTTDRNMAYLKQRTEAYMHRALEVQPAAADPVLAGGYQYWNCLTQGPFQFFGDPPYRPSKIIAAGEWTLLRGVIWVNPVNGPGGSLPGTIVLGGRHYRIRFETINLSDVVNGPDQLFAGVFSSPAPIVLGFDWWFIPPDPGPNPKLYETNLTADVVETGQPFAAFSTWHFDPDTEPSFLGLPTVGPRFQHDIPARYLVYRK